MYWFNEHKNETSTSSLLSSSAIKTIGAIYIATGFLMVYGTYNEIKEGVKVNNVQYYVSKNNHETKVFGNGKQLIDIGSDNSLDLCIIDNKDEYRINKLGQKIYTKKFLKENDISTDMRQEYVGVIRAYSLK